MLHCSKAQASTYRSIHHIRFFQPPTWTTRPGPFAGRSSSGGLPHKSLVSATIAPGENMATESTKEWRSTQTATASQLAATGRQRINVGDLRRVRTTYNVCAIYILWCSYDPLLLDTSPNVIVSQTLVKYQVKAILCCKLYTNHVACVGRVIFHKCAKFQVET